MRRQLAHAFSAKAVKEQTDIVLHYVNMWIQQLARVEQQGVDIVQWYNWLTFDIIGDLAFGEPFGAVEEGE
jgi:cytochrome P450